MKSFTYTQVNVMLLLMMLAGIGMALSAYALTQEHWKSEAVKNGAAEYITDKYGRPKWQWKQQPKQETP